MLKMYKTTLCVCQICIAIRVSSISASTVNEWDCTKHKSPSAADPHSRRVRLLNHDHVPSREFREVGCGRIPKWRNLAP